MKSYIWLRTFDGSIEQVEEEVAMVIPMVCREVFQNSTGSSKKTAIPLPERVTNTDILSLVLDYCRFHQVLGRSDRERRSFDEKFIRIDQERLCDLAAAAHSLKLKPLVDLTCKALARMIEGKTTEEIRETFHIPDDLTEEEKLEPIRNMPDDSRIRLLNRLYAKKRKELKEKEKQKAAEVEQEQVDVECSVDDLLSFINDDSKVVKAPKHKKKNRKRKDKLKDSCDKDKKELPCAVLKGEVSTGSSSQISEVHGLADDFEDNELDPAMKEEIDREVEEFARRLNLDWKEIH
ncbi:SKP1-like protein 21 [Papaver somniferum]|uniref:SKP1-like protein 21 n=1 Tax=Papaver somniferum TaxID=3469 RepID=UPI000E6FFB3B|nr:SKP1-like protein 21 [Papaver somniferum]